jgi:cell filamentation protein
VPEDPYSDPVTGVLYNKLGLRSAAALEAAEREITHAALILLDESPVSPSYNLSHLQEIHKRIFGDVFRWAGQIRTVNALHPFREGNGRAQRAFFGQLARDAGFTLAWQHLDPVRNVEASAAIMRGDPEPMREMLGPLVRDDT